MEDAAAEALRLADEAEAADEVTCMECGGRVPIGGWPYCASPRNPDGHARGVHTVSVPSGGGHMKRWTHTGSRGPR